MRISATKADAEKRKYVPPPLGNGDLSLQIDYQGMQYARRYCGMLPHIRRAGIRYDSAPFNFCPFGYFDQEINGAWEPDEWTQTLDLERGLVSTDCEYRRLKLNVHTDVFCHFEHNIIAIRKQLSTEQHFEFKYHLAAKRLKVRPEICDAGLLLKTEFDAGSIRRENIYVTCAGADLEASWTDGCYSLAGTMTECIFFIAFGEEAQKLVRDSGFEELFRSHCEKWADYWRISFIDVPSEGIRKTWYTAQYHLKISSTKWSIPTGLFDSHWHGRFFGFDEYFIQQGLLSSGHVKEARKISEFRASILGSARFRATSGVSTDNGGAFYPWETLENGSEGAPRGYWFEHIFHNVNIALGCCEVFQYTQDLDFLRSRGYPVIRACALNCLYRSVYQFGERVIIGKVTDMERLGTDHENAFMTTCGVIYLFRKAAECAARLKVDRDYQKQWRILADKLAANLPHDAEKYIPYPGCPTGSIGQLGGYYPYPILSREDRLGRNAFDDFIANERKIGNMYEGGQSVCAWYAIWETMAYLQLGEGEKALAKLEWLSTQTGVFSELFEIYERGMRPWFTTAEGAFIHAVDRLLLPEETSGIPPAWSAGWENFSFRLCSPAGKILDMKSRNRQWKQ